MSVKLTTKYHPKRRLKQVQNKDNHILFFFKKLQHTVRNFLERQPQ